jgi:hypothetical protein
MRAFTVSSEESQTIYAPFSLITTRTKTEENALLDSRATHNFIDIQTIIRLQIATQQLKEVRSLTNVDGTTNCSGAVAKYTQLTIILGKEAKKMTFYVTNLGRDRIILGMPWFKTFNPQINWEKGTLPHKIIMITQKATMEVNRITQATDWAIQAEQEKRQLTEDDIPELYREYQEVFSEEAAKRFPPSREEDHEIKLVKDAPKSFTSHTYQMDKYQTKFIRQWIKDELAKNFIRDSKSPYPSPTFLIKKKNGNYCVVQDYRQLNSYTVPDKTPLPLISDLIQQLHGKTLFTKFDICMGYNNIRIKDGDQEKATFTTPLGQYKPMVMSFRLHNTPGTFQQTMN